MELGEADRLTASAGSACTEGSAAGDDAEAGHLGTAVLEQLRLGALPPPEANLAKQHLDACARCRVRWQAVHADRAPFSRPRSPAPAEAPRRRNALEQVGLWAPALAVLAAVLFALAGGMSRGAFGTTITTPIIEARRAASGQRLASVRGGSAHYLLLFTRQGPGPWALAWPREGEVSGQLAQRGRTQPDLPEAATEVLGVFSEKPVARAVAEHALLVGGATPSVPGTWLVQVKLSP